MQALLIQDRSSQDEWYELLRNYLSTGEVPADMPYTGRRTLLRRATSYLLGDDGKIYRLYADQTYQRVALAVERPGLLFQAHAAASNGHRYLLVATDFTTKWVEATSLPNCTARSTAKFLYSYILARYGCQEELISDQGSHFVNQAIKCLVDEFFISHKTTTTYYPRGNGQVESTNNILLTMLHKPYRSPDLPGVPIKTISGWETKAKLAKKEKVWFDPHVIDIPSSPEGWPLDSAWNNYRVSTRSKGKTAEKSASPPSKKEKDKKRVETSSSSESEEETSPLAIYKDDISNVVRTVLELQGKDLPTPTTKVTSVEDERPGKEDAKAEKPVVLSTKLDYDFVRNLSETPAQISMLQLIFHSPDVLKQLNVWSRGQRRISRGVRRQKKKVNNGSLATYAILEEDRGAPKVDIEIKGCLIQPVPLDSGIGVNIITESTALRLGFMTQPISHEKLVPSIDSGRLLSVYVASEEHPPELSGKRLRRTLLGLRGPAHQFRLAVISHSSHDFCSDTLTFSLRGVMSSTGDGNIEFATWRSELESDSTQIKKAQRLAAGCDG
ncbi:hypothetical protein R1flu_016144 [Riccia fluitans]|uniref:Integrase catalytic domain-containing protein n=1 Tax=Riccia fluitans TaxID=41844 RepID=A0ABD1YKZ5_9MARC